MIAKEENCFENSSVIAEIIKTGYYRTEQLNVFQILKTGEDPSLHRLSNDFHTNICNSPQYGENQKSQV